MKKVFLLIMLLSASSIMAENVIGEESVTNYQGSSQNGSWSRLDLSDYCPFGVSYIAAFDNAGEGVLGLEGHILGAFWKMMGISFGGGWQLPFDKAGAVQFRLGPNFAYPLSETVYLYAPVQAVMNCHKEGSGKDEEWKTAWGAQVTPSIGLKFGKFGISAGVALGWVQHANKVSTGFSALISYGL